MICTHQRADAREEWRCFFRGPHSSASGRSEMFFIWCLNKITREAVVCDDYNLYADQILLRLVYGWDGSAMTRVIAGPRSTSNRSTRFSGTNGCLKPSQPSSLQEWILSVLTDVLNINLRYNKLCCCKEKTYGCKKKYERPLDTTEMIMLRRITNGQICEPLEDTNGQICEPCNWDRLGSGKNSTPVARQAT